MHIQDSHKNVRILKLQLFLDETIIIKFVHSEKRNLKKVNSSSGESEVFVQVEEKGKSHLLLLISYLSQGIRMLEFNFTPKEEEED